jgi:hypothetical protein
VSLDPVSRDYPYLIAMEEVLTQVLEFAERARNAKDDVMMGVYLKMTSRAVRCALEIYGEHLAQNRVEMERGEKVK